MSYLQIVEFTGKVSTDQTVRFPVTSSRSSKYLMILYNHDSNAILAEPLTSRRERKIIRATRVLHSYLSDCGLAPQYQMLYNECPGGLKTFLRDSSVKFQLVPTHLHCTNAAERAIQTYKDHLVVGLSSCDPNFPLHLWDRLIPHATLTLNLLCPSRLNPRLSAEDLLNGAFDYNRTPLAPPVTRVVVHEAPGNRRTWAPTVLMVGISDPPLTTTDVTVSTFCGTAPNVLPKLSSFFLTIAQSHLAAPQVPPPRPPAHSPMPSYILIQPRLQRWATINYPPSKHSPAFSPTSQQVPQPLLLPSQRAPHLLSFSNQIVLNHLRGCPSLPQLYFHLG